MEYLRNSLHEILEYSFMQYFYAFALPYFLERGLVSSDEDAIARSDLHSIAPRLRANAKIRAFSSANDFLITREDVDWLTGLLGEENVTFYESGGHMGNLFLPDVQQDVIRSIADLLPPTTPAVP